MWFESRQALSGPFFERDAVTVARELLGTLLVHRFEDGHELAGVVVETEAYRQDDPASHSHRGITPRTKVMFGPAGVSYVYFIYGMYDCFNVVCEPEETGAAVLVRALEPVVGWREMWPRRYGERPTVGWLDEAASETTTSSTVPPAVVRNLTSGPGKLCIALGIARERHNGVGLDPPRQAEGGDALYLLAPDAHANNPLPTTAAWSQPWREAWPLAPERVGVGTRVGIRKAAEKPWRFWVSGNPFVSKG